MKEHLRVNLLMVGLTLLVASVLYPLAVLAIGHGIVPVQASGSLMGPAGQPTGSSLVAQGFIRDEWFHSRPSAVSYNAATSGGSNFGANNPKLRERVEESIKSYPAGRDVPADAVTASGSGLDPHITLRNAMGQRERIASAWAKKTGRDPVQIRNEIELIMNDSSFEPLYGLVGGERLLNVVEVNDAMRRRFGQ